MLDLRDNMMIRELTGLNEYDFNDLMLRKIAPYNNDLLSDRPYAGCRSIISLEKFLVALVYLRTNITMRAIGRLSELSHQTVSRAVAKVSQVLGADEYQVCADEVRQIIVDGTLIQSYDARISNRCRNGKKCANVQLAVNGDGRRVVAVGTPVKGSTHDSKAFHISGLTKKLRIIRPNSVLGDLAYQGCDISIPIKKPKNIQLKGTKQVVHKELDALEKQFNRSLNKMRIRVERVLSVLKSWGVLRICRLVRTLLIKNLLSKTVSVFSRDRCQIHCCSDIKCF